MANVTLPPEPTPGEPLRAAWGATLLRWCRANQLMETPGMLLSRTASGTSFRPKSLPTPAPSKPPATYPFQALPSPWTGTGPDPHGADRAKRFLLQRGKFNGSTPTNMSDEFVAFGDPADAEIEEADAVYTQVYLQVPIMESALGGGNVTYSPGTVGLIEGGDLRTALGTIPGPGVDGSVPAYLVVPICEVAWWGGSPHFPPGVSTYLDAIMAVSGTATSGAQTRAFAVVGVVSYSPS